MFALIADDSGVIRSVLKRALSELSIEKIDEAADGREAIRKIEKARYDLIVTDWNMPFNNGLDVINAARAVGQTCPIVVQTTDSEHSKVIYAIAAGVNDYILKPFTKDEIRDKLEPHVNLARENSLEI